MRVIFVERLKKKQAAIKKIARFNLYFLILFACIGSAWLGSIQKADALADALDIASFYCDNVDGFPVTVGDHGGGSRRLLVRWQTNAFGSFYTPQRRCEIVSAKFDSLMTGEGRYRYLVWGKVTRVSFVLGGRSTTSYDVICASNSGAQNDPIPCPDNRVIMTLSEETDSQRTLRQLTRILSLGSGGPVLNHDAVYDQSPDGTKIGVDFEYLFNNAPTLPTLRLAPTLRLTD